MKEGSENTGDNSVNWKKEVIEWIKILATAAAIALFLDTCLIANNRVPTDSMENTIMAGDRIMGNRLAYRFGEHPDRGDIVIFQHKAEPGRDETVLVKRIIGLPGEVVDIMANQIYIDGSEIALEETYLPEPMESEAYHFEIPQGHYLMLGDNRNHSADARSWGDPYVPENEIDAKVLFRYYPGIKRIQ